MVNNNIWVIVGVALIVAVIASVITANITGNTIRLNQDKYGAYNVYTKMEIDARLINSTTNQVILNRLNSCQMAPIGNGFFNTNSSIDCNTKCAELDKTCVDGFVTVWRGDERSPNFTISQFRIPCNEQINRLAYTIPAYPNLEASCNCCN